MAPARAKFSEGERVLCFHGPLIYEAKCVKTRCKEQKYEYLVHYAGWNKKWDEYVPEVRVLKYNDTNLQKQKSLKGAHTANARTKKSVKPPGSAASPSPAAAGVDARRRLAEVSPSPSAASSGNGGTGDPPPERRREPSVSSVQSADEPTRASKRRRAAGTTDEPEPNSKRTDVKKAVDSSSETASDSENRKKTKQELSVETEEQFMTKVEVRIKLPDELKPWLVDDWDFVIRQKKLFQLPARTTAAQCIDEYVKHKSASKAITSNKLSAVREVSEGLKEYFNVMLGTQLLYKFERTQYADTLQEHKLVPMADLYGPIHILRLLVKLGPMLSYTELGEKSVVILQTHIQDFLRYMVRNAERLFSTDDYYVAPAEYHRRSP